MKRNKRTALIICLLTGYAGGHFIYLSEYHKAKVRFLWLFFCNPVAIFKGLRDLYRIGRMNDYQFKSTFCNKKIKGTESKKALHDFLKEIENGSKRIKDR